MSSQPPIVFNLTPVITINTTPFGSNLAQASVFITFGPTTVWTGAVNATGPTDIPDINTDGQQMNNGVLELTAPGGLEDGLLLLSCVLNPPSPPETIKGQQVASWSPPS